MSILGPISKVLHNSFTKTSSFSSILNRHYGIWEPDYLIHAQTKTPEYDVINVQIKGFDFAVLEKYQTCIHKIAKIMDIDVEFSWAYPHQHLHVKKFEPNSTKINSEYFLKVYERNVQVIDVKGHIMPLFLEAVITACPPGIKISVHEHTEEMNESRYVPNYEIKELEEQLHDADLYRKKQQEKRLEKKNTKK